MKPMKITDIELFLLAPRWLFVKISTDAGIAGWGEPVLEGRAETVRGAVHELRDLLIGHDASRIEDIWQMGYRGGFYRGGPILTSALSGIDQALWDIKGKALGVPVHDLLGGAVRDRVRVYAWVNGANPDELTAQALERKAQGYNAVKMLASDPMGWVASTAEIRRAFERIAAVREACGPEFDVAVDFHGRLHKGAARTLLREIEPLRPLFVEEPVLPENNEALPDLRQVCSIPIATGERMFTRWAFKGLLAQGAVDIVQPDISHCGGISELRKIATMAEAYDVAVAPHCPLGPICLAASLQADLCTPNAFIQEHALDIHACDGNEQLACLVEPGVFTVRDGHVHAPTGPGLGIEINEEYVRHAATTGHRWRIPLYRTPDGAVAEW